MAEPSLIERLREKPVEFVNAAYKALQAGQATKQQQQSAASFMALAYGTFDRAASTLEDQARLIGECREGLEEAQEALASVMADEYDAFYVKARKALDTTDALLTKLNAFGERDE